MLNIEYQPINKATKDNGRNGSAVLGSNSENGQDGRRGGGGNTDGAERHQERAEASERGRGAASDSGQGGEAATEVVRTEAESQQHVSGTQTDEAEGKASTTGQGIRVGDSAEGGAASSDMGSATQGIAESANDEQEELTEEEILSIEDPTITEEVKESAIDWLRGERDTWSEMCYKSIKEYVRNTGQHRGGNRGDTRSEAQLAGAVSGAAVAGVRDGGQQAGEGVGREDNEDVAGSGDGVETGTRSGGSVSGTKGSDEVAGEESATGRISNGTGGHVRGNRTGSRGGNVRKSRGESRGGKDTTTDGARSAESGTVGKLEETAQGLIDDGLATLRDIFKNPGMTKPGRLNDVTSLLAGLGVNAVRFMGATAKIGCGLVIKGYYKYSRWLQEMRKTMGPILEANTDLSDEQIAEYLRSAWDMKMSYRGKRKTVGEWAAELEAEITPEEAEITPEEAEEDVLCRPVTDKATLERLNSEPTVKVYRAMQLVDGGLRPPMSGKVDGQWREATEVGVWEEAEEHPEMANEKGKFKLDKGNGKSIKAAYNPYIHTSRSPINDQFSSAWSRPELVTVEVEIPESELTSGYKAEKAKDKVGEKKWKSGPVGRKLAKIGQARRVILSRWSRVLRIVPVEEVADEYAQRLNAHRIEVPFNTVPPALREALVERGVKIGKPEKGNAGKASMPAFEQWVMEQEQMRQGDGYGAYSDEEVSYANDPISKVMGKNRFSKKRQAEFASRERRRMVERVQELAKLMNLDNVEIVTDASQLEGKRAIAKGFYNKRTGKITIVIPNNVSTIDVAQTLLHEAVAHYGLRQLFGAHFDTFLDNVYESAEPEIRRKIAEMAAKNGWDFRTATEEYLAGLAEDTNFRESKSYNGWWSKIKSLFLDMLEKIGFEGFRDKAGVVLSDNELRYILWRSYENLAEPGRYRSILGEAADVTKQSELKVGNYAEQGIEAEHAAEGDLYRPGDFTPRDRVYARGAYEQILSSGSYQFKEAVQDSMLGLKKLYETILGKGTRIEDVEGFENSYLFENRMSSMNAGEQHEYFVRYMKPLLKEISRLVGSDKRKRAELTDYLMAKHGLERNERMREEAQNNNEDTDRDFAGLIKKLPETYVGFGKSFLC